MLGFEDRPLGSYLWFKQLQLGANAEVNRDGHLLGFKKFAMLSNFQLHASL